MSVELSDIYLNDWDPGGGRTPNEIDFDKIRPFSGSAQLFDKGLSLHFSPLAES